MNIRIPAFIAISIISLILFFLFWVQPINNAMLRLALIISGITFIVSSLLGVRKMKSLLCAFSVIIAVVFLFIANPTGSKIDEKDFRKNYVRNIKSYLDVKYVWGGETFQGIDCSGLPRKALIDTYREFGIFSFNGTALRESILHWWFDTSARAMRDGYRGNTIKKGEFDNILEIGNEIVLPGDIAVTSDGIHVLTYIGNGDWIHAEPGNQKVIIENVKNYSTPWFSAPIVLMSWKVLSTKKV
ncbi:MAG: C40 family peptidase [Deltaproteobacteria bacterium]|nr:C40 family peptidase [Deltaproteobacteria bacterium]